MMLTMGGGTGGDRGTDPTQTFQHLTLCLWAVHGKNQLPMVLVPPPQLSRCGATLDVHRVHSTCSRCSFNMFMMSIQHVHNVHSTCSRCPFNMFMMSIQHVHDIHSTYSLCPFNMFVPPPAGRWPGQPAEGLRRAEGDPEPHGAVGRPRSLHRHQ